MQSINAHPIQHKSNQVAFGQSASSALTNAAGVIVSTLYDKGPGVRYAVEQTIGYTVPRTAQQLYRNHGITGDVNPQAAKETLIRELSADFMDTFAPGLIATHLIGRVMDKQYGTVVKHNIANQSLAFYQSVANNNNKWLTSKEHFVTSLSDAIKQFSGHANPHFDLAKNIEAIRKGGKPSQQAALIAEQLGLKDLTVSLNNSAHKWEGSLTQLLEDVSHLVKMPNQQRILLLEKTATRQPWGQLLSRGIQRTVSLKRYQMLANAVAVVGSLSIPFVVRAITKKYYGHDSFPGTQEIHKYFEAQQKKSIDVKGHPGPNYNPERHKLLAKWFPYLHHSLDKNNIVPTVFSAAFFGFLGAMVLRRFHVNQASLFKAKDWFRIYQFDRGFPFTSLPQMEISYGTLCGVRLLSSRNDAEFRETAFRDCILGFPTLTYFTDWFKPKVMAFFNNRLSKQHGLPNILMRPDKEVRIGQEISPLFYRNMGLSSNKASALAKTAKNYHNWGTLMVAGVSWTLLAWLEPQLGIWLTNYFELNRYQPQSAVQHKK